MTDALTRPGLGVLARPQTFLNLVLDASGSMLAIRQATVAAFNAFLAAQQGNRIDEVFVTVSTFNNQVRTLYVARPLAEVHPLRVEDFDPDGGTALYDGLAKTLRAMDRKVHSGQRVLTVLITDGAENESREVTSPAQMQAVVREYARRGNWTFVYLGAHPDLTAAQTAARDLGFPPGNAAYYTASGSGVTTALARVDTAVQAYRGDEALQTDRFWADRPKRYRRPVWS